MKKDTIVDRLYREFKELISYLDQNGQISFRNTVNENFSKALLLAAASYFESRLTEHLLAFVHEVAKENQLIVKFVENKAFRRQYHTLFNWEATNANQFYGLFGETFKTFMTHEIKRDTRLDESVKAFLELGRDRNSLVHQNFGEFTVEKTADEIYQRYQTALYFVESLPDKLRNCKKS
jgi:hypothetical protein